MNFYYVIFDQIEKDARSDSENDLDVCGHSDEEDKSKSAIGDTVPHQRIKNGSVKSSKAVTK